MAVVAAGRWWLASNTLHNMQVRGIQSGFDFLGDPAGFDIGESLFPFDSAEPYWQAFLVGLSNTLRVAIIGIILTTILGTLLGVGRFSRNALVRGLCYAYVEFFRNVPVLLQLLMWYLLFTEVLPAAQDAWTLGPLFLSKGGLSFPIPIWEIGHLWGALGLMAGAMLAWLYRRWSYRHFEATGELRSMVVVPFAIFVVVGVLALVRRWRTVAFQRAHQGRLLHRAGRLADPRVPVGAAGPDRLHRGLCGRSRAGRHQLGVARPGRGGGRAGPEPGPDDAAGDVAAGLRVIIPPMTNQFLNLTKNSSLAVAIGYPDVVSIANTALNQTGRAVECIAIVMLVYLTTSLTTSLLMNWYNTRSAIKER